MIETFKTGSGGKSCDFFINCPLPPDFNTFWKQASQQDWNPKLATVAKVMLFPTDVYALGDLSNNVATDCWFSPNAPYKSSLTGMTANTFAANYQKVTRSAVGAVDGFDLLAVRGRRRGAQEGEEPARPQGRGERVEGSGLRRHVWSAELLGQDQPGQGQSAIIKPVGIQWKPGSTELVGHKKFAWSPWVVDNTLNKHIPIQATLEPTNA